MRPIRRASVLFVVAALALTGCGITDPYTTSTRAVSGTATRAIGDGEHDGPPPPGAASLGRGATAASPQTALARYGELYVNWTAATLPAKERRLASISTGQAREQALAESKAPPQTLTAYAVSNSGQVVAIAPGRGAERGRWAVITDEQTSGNGPYQGLPATSHVTWATVASVADGWVVSGWYPGS